jgi:hypothetical protein
MRAIAEDWDVVGADLSSGARKETDQYDRPQITVSKKFGALDQPGIRAFSWLAEHRVSAADGRTLLT